MAKYDEVTDIDVTDRIESRPHGKELLYLHLIRKGQVFQRL